MALHLLTGKSEYVARAEAIPTAFSAELARNLISHCGLVASIFDLNVPQQVAIVGEDRRELLAALQGVAMPGALELSVPTAANLGASPVVKAGSSLPERTAAYVCVGPQCSLPITEPQALLEALRQARLAAI